MYTIGLPEREPLKVGGESALYATGISAFSATMLAIYVRTPRESGNTWTSQPWSRRVEGPIDGGMYVQIGDGEAKHELGGGHTLQQLVHGCLLPQLP